MSHSVDQIEDVLRRAEQAHSIYEETELNGRYDEDWPSWYAAWAIAQGINDLLGASFDAQRLSRALLDANVAYEQEDSDETWAWFTARFLLHMGKNRQAER